MLSDLELWACANHYVARHGAGAAVIAAFRADELLAACDHHGVHAYVAIIERIHQLLERPAGPLH